MFEVVNTFVVIEISKGKINTIAINNPTFVVLSNFFNVFIILGFKLFINLVNLHHPNYIGLGFYLFFSQLIKSANQYWDNLY